MSSNFNSKLVQFKVKYYFVAKNRLLYFNSKLVQFKAHTLEFVVTDNQFQFQTGTIQSIIIGCTALILR